jgi:hypothetical protein
LKETACYRLTHFSDNHFTLFLLTIMAASSNVSCCAPISASRRKRAKVAPNAGQAKQVMPPLSEAELAATPNLDIIAEAVEDLLIEADIGLGQVRYARQHGRVPTRQIWMTASGISRDSDGPASGEADRVRLCTRATVSQLPDSDSISIGLREWGADIRISCFF